MKTRGKLKKLKKKKKRRLWGWAVELVGQIGSIGWCTWLIKVLFKDLYNQFLGGANGQLVKGRTTGKY